MSAAVHRVAIVGAECVGKTTLARALAQRLGGLWVGEYLREFCDLLGRTPRPNEQAEIVAEQLRREQAGEAAARAAGLGWLFVDSVPLVTAAYSELLFAEVSLHAAALAHHARYHTTLLLAPDLPWVADGIQRDGPAVRARFHALLTRALEVAGLPYTLITGSGAAREGAAEAALRSGQQAAQGHAAEPQGAACQRSGVPDFVEEGVGEALKVRGREDQAEPV
ncbi:MAG: ATP-binding protein [Proteobacteria bacterium]|nr:ATP-binding protein [Pseudomonadota bacterium]